MDNESTFSADPQHALAGPNLVHMLEKIAYVNILEEPEDWRWWGKLGVKSVCWRLCEGFCVLEDWLCRRQKGVF